MNLKVAPAKDKLRGRFYTVHRKRCWCSWNEYGSDLLNFSGSKIKSGIFSILNSLTKYTQKCIFKCSDFFTFNISVRHCFLLPFIYSSNMSNLHVYKIIKIYKVKPVSDIRLWDLLFPFFLKNKRPVFWTTFTLDEFVPLSVLNDHIGFANYCIPDVHIITSLQSLETVP